MQSKFVYIGEHFVIPEVKNDEERQTEYVVKAGDSLYEIARRYNTTAESIMVLNNLESPDLSIGQRLRIPVYSDVVVNADNANIRQRPGTAFNTIAQMDRRARLPLIGVQGDWYKVALFNGEPGWISKTVSTLRAFDGSVPTLQILGYYTLSEDPTLPSSYESFVANTANISQNGLFLFRISKDNPTTIEKFGEFTDEETQTPMFAYTDANGVNHEVWFENRESIKAKAELAHRLGIRGLALWRLVSPSRK